MKKLILKVKKHFEPKTRAEIIDQKIVDIMHDILIHDFTNEEIAFIINGLRSDGKDLLIRRKKALENETIKTTIAINTL